MKKLSIMTAAVSLLLVTTACEEENPFGNLEQWEQEFAKEYLKAEAAVSDMYRLMDDVMRDSVFADLDSSEIGGARVTRSGNLISISYETGTVDKDGRLREGVIEILQSGDYFTSGGSLTAGFNNFKVDNDSYSGSLAITHAGTHSYDISATSFSVNDYFNLNGVQSITWRNGFETITDPKDDLYEISGSVTGSDTSSQSLVAAIEGTDPLLFDRSCKFRIVSGLVNLAITADSTETQGSLDFRGDDGCQNIVEITVMKDGSKISLIHQFEGF